MVSLLEALTDDQIRPADRKPIGLFHPFLDRLIVIEKLIDEVRLGALALLTPSHLLKHFLLSLHIYRLLVIIRLVCN